MNPDPQSQPEGKPDPYYGGPLGAGIDWTDPNSPLAPYYFTTGGVLAVAVLGIAFFFLSILPLWHTDFWAHLKYGEWIVANRELPDREPLNPFTDKQTRMFDAMWLAQVGYHGLFRAGWSIAGGDDGKRLEGGVEVIRVAHSLAAIVALGLFGLAYRRAASSVPWAIGGMAIVFVLMIGALSTQRPQVLALACFATLLCMLSRPVLTRRALTIIPLLMVLWANLHGSFVVGFVMLGVLLAGRAIEIIRAHGFATRAAWRDESARRLAIALLAALGAVGLLNPYGPYLYLHVVRFGGHPNLGTMAEWQPLDFSQSRGGHWAYLALALVVLATPLVTKRMYSPGRVLLILAFGVWPVFQQRMMAWWIPLVPWVVAPYWVVAAARWSVTVPENVPSFRKTALAILLAAVAVVASPASTWMKSGKPRPIAKAIHRGTPNDIAAALRGEHLADVGRVRDLADAVLAMPGGRYVGTVFCSESQGEFLLWSLPADTPVMMFNHAQLFEPGYWSECMAVKHGEPNWREVLNRSRAGVVIVETDYHPRLCAELRKDPEWVVVVDEVDFAARAADARLFVALRKSALR